MITEVILPVMGETMNEGTIVEWLKKEGDSVERGDVLFSIESDKATLEVEAPAKGCLKKIIVPAGQSVPVLTVVGLITKNVDEDVSNYIPASNPLRMAKTQSISERDESSPIHLEVEVTGERVFASPRARKLAEKEGISISRVIGSGPQGRIVERDVKAFKEALQQLNPLSGGYAEYEGLALGQKGEAGLGSGILKNNLSSPVETSKTAKLEAVSSQTENTRPMTGVRAIIAKRMYEGHNATAPVTLTMEIDATEFVRLREHLKASMSKSLGFSIGYNDLLMKASALALREFPYMNSRLDEAAGVIVNLSSVHIALAVESERGLMVPLVRDVDTKSLAQVASELRRVIERARSGKASPDELSGSSFTITNLGMFEVDAFTPIINMPESAILGVGRIKDQAAVRNGGLCVRKMLWLSLTFDHRLMDGAAAAAFLQYIKTLIEDPFVWLSVCM